MYLTPVSAVHGEHFILWHEDSGRTVVTQIVLAEKESRRLLKSRSRHSNKHIADIIAVINGNRSTAALRKALAHCSFQGCTLWQQQVWSTLASDVKAGHVISYGGLAEKCGRPGAARSVGSIMAQNRFPLLIPCHRVVASGGKLGGFMNGRRDGLRIKRALLAAENVHYVGNILKNDEALLS